jgi:hypothetical protein
VTEPFHLPVRKHGVPLVLQLNIVSAIGRGATVELRTAGPIGKLLGVSERIIDGGVAFNVSWSAPPKGGQVSRWVPDGCELVSLRHSSVHISKPISSLVIGLDFIVLLNDPLCLPRRHACSQAPTRHTTATQVCPWESVGKARFIGRATHRLNACGSRCAKTSN